VSDNGDSVAEKVAAAARDGGTAATCMILEL